MEDGWMKVVEERAKRSRRGPCRDASVGRLGEYAVMPSCVPTLKTRTPSEASGLNHLYLDHWCPVERYLILSAMLFKQIPQLKLAFSDEQIHCTDDAFMCIPEGRAALQNMPVKATVI